MARHFASVVGIAWLLTATSGVHAQTGTPIQPYPNKPVRLILGPAPGGSGDIITRIVASALSEFWGQQVVVDNRPGAGNTIATAIVARSVPDGYTLLRCGVADVIAPALYKKLPYDFMRDITLMARIGTTPNVMVVHSSVPAKSISEFIAIAKAHPGKYSYAATGVGQSPQLSFELFKSMANVDVLYVPYKSTGLATADMLAGRVSAQINNLPSMLDNIRSGKVRPLGVSSLRRNPKVPEVPTIAESLPGFEVMSWTGMCAPSAVQRGIVKKIEADMQTLLATPALRQRLDEIGVDADPLNAEQFTALAKVETVRWAKVVKDAGIPQQ